MTGLGIGFVNTIVPSWISELSAAHNRGSNFAIVFVANFAGIVIAYWINFGIRNSTLGFRWRFPLAFMAVPMLIVMLALPLLPESPRSVAQTPSNHCMSLIENSRWLIANLRREEAIEILVKLRGDLAETDPIIVTEVEQLDAIVESSQHKRNSYINIFMGGRYSGPLHLGRRAIMYVKSGVDMPECCAVDPSERCKNCYQGSFGFRCCLGHGTHISQLSRIPV